MAIEQRDQGAVVASPMQPARTWEKHARWILLGHGQSSVWNYRFVPDWSASLFLKLQCTMLFTILIIIELKIYLHRHVLLASQCVKRARIAIGVSFG